MKPNFILIHSTGGNADECWYPWLKSELKMLGCKVFTPEFPTPYGQTLDNWMAAFEPYFEKIDENTVFIGRSIGPPFILRVLELLNKPVKASFLVAGFCSDIGLKEFRPVLDTFIDKPFNWNKIRANCQKFIVYHSVDDPIVPLKNGEELAEKLGVKLRVFEDGGHFNIGTMYGLKFEEILEDVKELL